MTKKKNLKLNNAAGFSLVELMVVVAIIGILASVAVPQFQKFTYKARLVEAKAGLSSLYTSEKAFYGEWSQYDNRFQVIGYAPEGTYYFNMGFNGGTNSNSSNWSTAGNTAPTTVHSATKGFCNTNTTKCKSMVSATDATAAIPTTATVNNPSSGAANFTGVAMAAGTLHPNGTLSTLSIDENKNLKQTSGGI